MRSSSILSVVAAVTGWASLAFSVLTALLEGGNTGIVAFLIAAAVFGIVGVALAVWAMSRDTSRLGRSMALFGAVLGLGLLLAAAGWSLGEYNR